MDQVDVLYRLGIALLIGFVIGLQREVAQADDKTMAGSRTFSLIGLAGGISAYLAGLFEAPILFVAVVLAIASFIGIFYFADVERGKPGLTSEIAAVTTFLIGGLCMTDRLEIPIATGVAVLLILAIKVQARRLARGITQEDVVATLKFAVITAIILPVLPNQTYGPAPFNVVSPRNVWMMVVLISGISFLGYILIKIIGTKRGVGLTGLLGGLASSTAVTLSLSQRSAEDQSLARPLALGIILSWIVMFARVLIEVSAVNRDLLRIVWMPVAAAGLTGLAFAAYLMLTKKSDSDSGPERWANPFELGPAISFGILYGVILIVANAARLYFGDAGIYVSSAAAGLADVDAITLSLAQLTKTGEIAASTASRAIVLAVVSNTIVKGLMVLFLGTRGLRNVVLPGLLVILVVALTVGLM
jgi:uncharacterized membrane protein (DUF4010 family)